MPSKLASRPIPHRARSSRRGRPRPERNRRQSPVRRRNRAFPRGQRRPPCRRNIRCCARTRRSRLRRRALPPRHNGRPRPKRPRARPCRSRFPRPYRSNRAMRRLLRPRPRLKILQLLRSVCRFRRHMPRDGTRDRVQFLQRPANRAVRISLRRPPSALTPAQTLIHRSRRGNSKDRMFRFWTRNA